MDKFWSILITLFVVSCVVGCFQLGVESFLRGCAANAISTGFMVVIMSLGAWFISKFGGEDVEGVIHEN